MSYENLGLFSYDILLTFRLYEVHHVALYHLQVLPQVPRVWQDCLHLLLTARLLPEDNWWARSQLWSSPHAWLYWCLSETGVEKIVIHTLHQYKSNYKTLWNAHCLYVVEGTKESFQKQFFLDEKWWFWKIYQSRPLYHIDGLLSCGNRNIIYHYEMGDPLPDYLSGKVLNSYTLCKQLKCDIGLRYMFVWYCDLG